MANTTTTVTTTKGNKTVSKTTTNERPGAAWVKDKKGKWIKPPQPSGEYAWDDNDGWISNAAQAEAWKLPLTIINSDPNLTALFNEAWEAMKKGTEWSQEQFTVRLQATDWYKTKSAAQRKYYTLSTDPAQAEEFNAQVAAEKAKVSALASQYGTTLSDVDILELAKTKLRDGLDDTQTGQLLSTYISYDGKSLSEVAGSLFGRAGDVEDGIRDWAKRNGITVSDSWVLDHVKQAVATGTNDFSKAKDSITAMAKQTYSHWADKLDGISTLDDLAAGYKNIISDEMDEDFKNLGMDNRWVKSAMEAKDANGAPINNDTLRQTLYKTNEWSNVTKNKNKIMAAGQDLLSRMGIM